jgi:hypothetical protein
MASEMDRLVELIADRVKARLSGPAPMPATTSGLHADPCAR